MNNQPTIPDPSVSTRLINNLRRSRLDFEEARLQLEEVIAKFDEILEEQRLERIKKKQQLSLVERYSKSFKIIMIPTSLNR
ncbi:hypothetical protein [Gloeocapsa sp. PCC 73106]|uniref:hypothetical protein n=1 Tax=Gloeocapsa sp. PCC 73106 TaxID=102232 RepID=UPI0002AC0304|nr:hypothetical protein [Gloeocapsa sp. PCC 73106]ELR98189.1 hypothetical protein GLO73106DRAFT_00020160 [Gloeocapsa sp. PCC 73106]